ncbi:MAG: ABC transporter substrate-binding protein [Hylemonella sp.]|nr:ABC transporter substrate-binding protein [Hylemonella sp.]MDP1937392.1 ABC transporter substrate-binding protein [Hylemonella sp.]
MKRVFLKSIAASALLVSGLAQAQQPVEIVVDYPYAGIFKEVHEKIARDFTAKFPQYKVTFRAPTPGYEEAAQQSLRQAVTNQLPDVSYQGLNRQRVFVDRGIAVDMTPFIKSEKDWAKMGYDKALLSLGQVGDKQVGIGFSLSTPIVYFNADLVRKAGVSPEQFPTSWDGIADLAKKAKAANAGTQSMHMDWEITGNWMWQALVFSNGGTMLTPDEKKVAFDGPAGKTAMQTFAKVVKDGEMRDGSLNTASQDFVSGNLAILVTSTSRLGLITKQVGNRFDLRTARMPIEKNGRLPAGGNVAMMFAKDPAKQKAAWEYIKFATGPLGATAMVQGTGYFPANTIPANDANLLKSFYEQHPNYLTAIKQLPVLTGWYAFPGENGLKITDVIKDHIQSVISKEATPEKALAAMTRDVQALLPR